MPHNHDTLTSSSSPPLPHNRILLIWFLIIISCEIISFYLVPLIDDGLHITPHYRNAMNASVSSASSSSSSSSPPPSHWVLLLADPQISDPETYTMQNPLITPLFLFQESYYAKRVTYASIKSTLTPKWHLQEQYWLGDYLDGNLVMEEPEFQYYSEKLWHLYGRGPHNTSIITRNSLQDNILPKKSIFVFGNHDISNLLCPWKHERIERMRPMFGVEEFSGYRDYPKQETRVIWINSAHLSSFQIDGYSGEKAREAWEFIDKMQEMPLPSASWKVVLLSHVPFYHNSNHRCNSPLWFQRNDYIEYSMGLNHRNMLMPRETEYILDSLRPSLVISADHHFICRYEHLAEHRTRRRRKQATQTEDKQLEPLQRAVKEDTIASVGLLSGNSFPGLAVLDLASLQVKHIFLPPVVVFFFLYGGFWCLCGLYVVVSVVRQAKSVRQCAVLLFEEIIVLFMGGLGIYLSSFLYWLWVWNGDYSGLL